MGSAASANHEWIELYNGGGSIDVTGWTISDGMNLHIELSGIIPAGAYVVLERTSDDSTAGTAFLVYTGALVNTGATLSLQRSDGGIEDQVSGGDDWQSIGGDNATKETAQYTERGWVTAVATPGRTAVAIETDVDVVDDTEGEVTSSSPTTLSESHRNANTSEPVVLTLPDVTLTLKIKAQAIGYVHQLIQFTVEPSGIGDTLIDSLQYEWNFGDGVTAKGKEVSHNYEYPGTYAVTVYGGYKRQEQVSQYEITILPVTISLTKNSTGAVQVNNDSPYDIDVSGYQISADKVFVFPPRSIILSGQTVTVPRHKILTTPGHGSVSVADGLGSLVATLDDRITTDLGQTEEGSSLVVSSVENGIVVPVTGEQSEAGSGFTFAGVHEVTVENQEEVEAIEITGDQAEDGALLTDGSVVSPSTVSQWPYLALAATLFLATIGLYVAPRRNES